MQLIGKPTNSGLWMLQKISTLNHQPLGSIVIIVVPLDEEISMAQINGDVPKSTQCVVTIQKYQPNVINPLHVIGEFLLIFLRTLVDDHQFPIGIGLIEIALDASLEIVQTILCRDQKTTDFWERPTYSNHTLTE